jgi:hypothetical protein
MAEAISAGQRTIDRGELVLAVARDARRARDAMATLERAVQRGAGTGSAEARVSRAMANLRKAKAALQAHDAAQEAATLDETRRALRYACSFLVSSQGVEAFQHTVGRPDLWAARVLAELDAAQEAAKR